MANETRTATTLKGFTRSEPWFLVAQGRVRQIAYVREDAWAVTVAPGQPANAWDRQSYCCHWGTKIYPTIEAAKAD